MKEANEKWVSEERVIQIIDSILPNSDPEPNPGPDEEADDKPAVEPEGNPEPNPEPAPHPVPEPEPLLEGKAQSEQFSSSVRMLKRLMTKSVASFVDIVSADDLESVGLFLSHVASEMKKKAEAA